MTRHITIQTVTATHEAIDDAIDAGLQQLSEKHAERMELVNVATMHRSHDNTVFVTVIAKGIGQVKAVKSKEPKKQ